MMSREMSLVFLAVLATWMVQHADANRSKIPDVPYLGFSTKTSYYFTKRAFRPPPISNPGCEPVFLWFYGRHGTRFPKELDIRVMESVLTRLKPEVLIGHLEGRGIQTRNDLDAFRRWSYPYKAEDDKELAFSGQREMYSIGRRFRLRLQSLFANATVKDFKVISTDTNRTYDSAKAFLKGCFGPANEPKFDILRGTEDNTTLRWYKSCLKYQVEVDENPRRHEERLKFQEAPAFRKAMEEMSLRMGLSGLITQTEIKAIYDACRFDIAITPLSLARKRAWCTLFTKEDLRMLEYWQDLEKYWADGYGYEINYVPACIAIKDFADYLRAFSDPTVPDPELRASFAFTHNGAISKVYARLGLFKDAEHLRADNYEQSKNRLWNTSKMNSFAANLAFLVERCEGSKLKVTPYANEEEIKIPALEAANGDFLDAFGEIIDTCNLDLMCRP